MSNVSMVFTPLQKLIVTIVLLAIAIVALGWGYWWFYSRVRAARDFSLQTEAELVSLEENRTTARRIQRLFKERVADRERMRAFLVDSQRPIIFVEELEAIARRTGSRMTLTVDERRSTPGTLFFSLSAEGSEKAMRNFLSALEQVSYAVRPEEVVFQRIAEEVASGMSLPAKTRLVVGFTVRTTGP